MITVTRAFNFTKDRIAMNTPGKEPAERVAQHGYKYCLVAENIAYEFSSAGFTTRQLAQELLEGWLSRWNYLRDFPASRRKFEWQAQDATSLP